MNGLMQRFPLNLARILEHAARFHGDTEVVSNTVEGGIHRYGYAEALVRSQRLARALADLGVGVGDRIGTLAWNGYRHLEAWYAIAGQGAICHTINPRLFADQIVYIINHAQDRLLLLDLSFVPLVESIQHRLTTVEAFVIMTDAAHMPETTLSKVLCYETLLAAADTGFRWPALSEETASSLCYTSGTTGQPKGVLYSHRSNLLMAMTVLGADCFGLSASSTTLMVVPMFHANAWGLVYAAPMAGAKLVLPGPHHDGASLLALIQTEGVILSAAVPTVWNGLLRHTKDTGGHLGSLKEVIIGGAAVPRSMIEALQNDHNVAVLHAWGMTETSPLGTLNRPLPGLGPLGPDAKVDLACSQGRPMFGIELCLKTDQGEELPNDGKTCGRLMVRGPWVAERYFLRDEPILDEEGWFDTGDIATIDKQGFMRIVDRAKDVIKSGGEWISSIELENAAMGHPEVELAAVIGMPHEVWTERPLLIVKPRDPAQPPSVDSIKGHLALRVAKWWVPENITFIDAIPLAATGKINKVALRERFASRQKPAG